MVKQTNVSFESKYLRMLNNIAKRMVENSFEIKVDESYLIGNLSKTSMNKNRLSLSINDNGCQLIIFGDEGADFNNINYCNFENIFTGIVIKDLNIEKYLREETRYGKFYGNNLSKVIGKTLLDELSDLNSNNDFTNHQTLNLIDNLTPGLALLIYVKLMEIGSRYNNYDSHEIKYYIDDKDVNEGIYRDLDLCKFLLEDLKNYFSEDVLVDRVTNAISEYISDDKDTYKNVNYFCISNSRCKTFFDTIVKCFGKDVFVSAVQKLVISKQHNLNDCESEHLRDSELKSHFIFAKSILKFLKEGDFSESQKKILFDELMFVFFEKDEHSEYTLHRKWQQMFDVAQKKSTFDFRLNDFKERFREAFGMLIDYLKENRNTDRTLFINAPTHSGCDLNVFKQEKIDDEEFDIFNPYLKNFLNFFDFAIKIITDHKAEHLFKIVTLSYNDEFITLDENEDLSSLRKTKDYRELLNLSLDVFSEISEGFEEGSKDVLNNLINSANYRLSQIDSK